MNRIFPLLLAPALALPALALLPTAGCAQKPRAVQAPPAGPVDALVYSTMPSTNAHRPEMALDGDPNTYFQTVYGMDEGDDFEVILSRAIPVSSLQVITGDPDGQDKLTSGIVETSPDSVHFTQTASFGTNGIASATGQRLVRAIRLRLNPGQNVSALVIREISLNSPVKLAHVQLGPGRGFVDISRAPEVAAWAATAEKQMEESWADTAALLYSDKFITPNAVNVVYRTGPGVTGIAATGGGVMTVNTAWCHAHPDDTGLTVHETSHVIQAYSAYDPVWLVEGIADYIRWVRFEPEHFHPRINVKRATYHDAYQTTATFLAWCEQHYDSRLVTKLSQDVRFGTYKTSLFQKYTGKDVDTLWSEFIADYQADPANILTPPVASADKPRVLPAVVPGSGTPVDLSTQFNTVGIAHDGGAFALTGGLDGGGVSYSGALLGRSVTWQNVPFALGPPDAPDVISCRGQVVPLPSSSYSGLWLLGTAINGGRRSQDLLVTYTDGTTAALTQNFSDWYAPGRFPGESRAVAMPYRDNGDGSRDPRTFYAYSYGFNLDPAKTVRSLTLPADDSVKLLAATLTK